MCDNLGLRWRPPMRWHRIPVHCRLQRREWFVVPLSVLLRRLCKNQINIPSCTKTTLCIHDCPVIAYAYCNVFHLVVKMDTEQIQLLQRSIDISALYIFHLIQSAYTVGYDMHACINESFFKRHINTDAPSTSQSAYVTAIVSVFLLSSWSQ